MKEDIYFSFTMCFFLKYRSILVTVDPLLILFCFCSLYTSYRLVPSSISGLLVLYKVTRVGVCYMRTARDNTSIRVTQ